MTARRAPRALYLLGALLVIYLGYPVVAFLVRAVGGHDEGWHTPGLWSALRVSVEGATIALAIGVLIGIPLAYLLARSRGPIAAVASVIVQLPLAVPPLISGILLVYIIGPYTFLGQHTGERLTQTMYGVIIAMSFVSIPFLVIAARSAFRAVDPSLSAVAATLGHGPVRRFLRVEVPAAADGIRAGMILMWLRAFGEYGTVVVLAYHPYSLPVYVENLFSSAPLSQTEAPTLLAFAVAILAILAGRLPRPRRLRRTYAPAPTPPPASEPTPVSFALDTHVGNFSLQVTHQAQAHRLAIVGASGAGKTVTLQALAGLLGTRVGSVSYGDLDVTRLATERRSLGYVPQGYGLMPGRTVWQQATFGRHADPGRAAWWLRTLELDGLLDRLPEQLSGGQRQRVSLARALAGDPSVVLLDEPFSALDTPVRSQLRRELRRLQQQVNLSTVLVTHDATEAAMLADEILVVGAGGLLQSGACREVFQRPGSVEIGQLLGIENLFEAEVRAEDVPTSFLGTQYAGTYAPGTRLLWQVPPEALRVAADHPDLATEDRTTLFSPARVSDVIDLGRTVEVVLTLPDGEILRARSATLPELSVGADCRVEIPPDAVAVWPAARNGSATPRE